MSTYKWNLNNIINLEVAKKSIEYSKNYLLKVDDIEFFGQGWDNVAFLVNGKYIFRFPRHQEAEQLLCDENKVLPKLHSMIHLQIPNLIYFGKPNEWYPFHFHGYKILAGIPAYCINLSDEQLRICLLDLARFLKKIHSIKSIQALEMGAQAQMYDKTKVSLVVKSLQTRMKDIFQKNIFEFDNAFIDQIIEQVQKIIIDHDNDCLVHGDLDYRHMLIDQNKLIGIIDWGDVGINHPVIDYAIVHLMFPKNMQSIFFETYGFVSEDIWLYAKFLALHRAVTLMFYGHDIKDMQLFETAKKSYERLKN